MQYDRCLLFAVAVNIIEVELGWQTEVQLTGRECDLITDRRLYVYVKFRTLESSLADLLGVFDADTV